MRSGRLAAGAALALLLTLGHAGALSAPLALLVGTVAAWLLLRGADAAITRLARRRARPPARKRAAVAARPRPTLRRRAAPGRGAIAGRAPPRGRAVHALGV